MGYDGNRVEFKNGEHIATKTLVWAAGIAANVVPGLRSESYTRGRRLTVNRINQVDGYDGVFAIGDAAYMVDDEKWPGGHPQVAQVAIQQAKNLAKNFILMADGKEPKPFRYINLGTMATIGRNKAVVDLSWIKFKGLFAWMIWMFIHLRSIFGVKNKILVFVNWVWSYLTYDQSLRLTFLPKGFKFKSVH
jgi:NADH dehydrogenase